MCANYRQYMNSDEFQIRYDLPRKVSFDRGHLSKLDVYPNRSSFVILPSLELKYFMWGLLPRGATTNEVAVKYSTFNARSETVTESRLYKPAWNDGHRCVIPVTNYTEWRGPKGNKEKLFIRQKSQDYTFIAGIYDATKLGHWEDGDGFQTFTMLTCEPNEFSKAFHHRMPVILDDWRGWLNPDLTPEEALDFCRPFSGELEFVKD